MVNTLTFKNPLSPSNIPKGTLGEHYFKNYRTLTGRFETGLASLKTSLKRRTNLSSSGKLKGSRLAFSQFPQAKVFTKTRDRFDEFNLTFVFLVDVSGSMGGRVGFPFGGDGDRLAVSKCIMRSLCRAIQKDFKGRIFIDILLKTSVDSQVEEYGVPVILGKVYSSLSKDQDLEVIDKIGFESCVADGKRGWGNSTPEFALGKAIDWYMKNEVTTKKVIVINLTDGGAYTTIGLHNAIAFGEDNNEKLLKKYTKSFPMISFMIGCDAKGYPNKVIADNQFGRQMLVVFNKVLRSLEE